MQFAGRNALITGASSGIGKSLAVALAGHGAKLWLVARSRERLIQALCGAASEAAAISLHEADLSNPHGVSAFIGEVLPQLEGLDLLIHSAGTISLGPVEAASADQFDAQYQVNLRAPYVLTQALLPLLKKSRGQVLFVNSTAGLRANSNASQYSATKHGLKALADSLREEVNHYGVRVMSLYAGRTNTPMQRGIIGWEGRTWAPDSLLQPEDIAEIVLHSLSLPRTAEVTDLSLRPFKKYPE